MNRLPRLLALALFALPAWAFAGDDAPASIPTTAAPADRPGVPSEARPGAPPCASQSPAAVELDATVPAGVTPLSGAPAGALYGTLKLGDAAIHFAVVLPADGKGDATLYEDADHDGRFDPAEGRGAKAEDWKAGPRVLGQQWTTSELGRGHVALTVRQRTPEFTVQAASSPATAPPVTATLAPAAPAAVKVPAKLPGTMQYGTVKVGDQEILFAVARGEGDALALVVDATGAGDLERGTLVSMTPTPMTRGKKRTGTRWMSDPVDVRGKPRVFLALAALADVSALVNETQTRQAVTKVGGNDYSLFLVDGDLDGRFDGAEDLWWFGPTANNPKPRSDNMFPSNEPTYGKGEAWRLTAVAADGTASVARAADVGSVEGHLRKRSERVNARRWFPRFADDLEFAKRQKLDESRPRAEKPVAFHFALSLADAKALAAKEGKPLLVDFEADWCIWCKRLDYHTYVDREVAAEMAKFCAVKVNNEIDPDQSFRQPLGLDGKPWGGIPAVVFFTPKGDVMPFHEPTDEGAPTGKVVDHISGWRTPQAFAASLRSALGVYEDVKAGKAPPEFVAEKPEAPKAPPAPPGKPTAPAPAPAPAPTAPK